MLTIDVCKNALQRAKEKTTEIEDYTSIPTSTFSCIENELSVLEQLINEHFELVKELDEIKNPHPYRFNDLKVGMLVWDESPEYEEFRVFKITKIFTEADCQYFYHDKNKKVFFDDMVCHAREFEENRFFPLTKGMKYYREEKENVK